MPKVTANKITMNYDQQGTGEPLILIPYLAADHACYAFQVPEYARHFTCISVDLRGTGESDKPQGAYTTELLADDVAAFMQAMGIAKAHVAGLSLGGAVGMWLAVKHPDKVASLSVHSGWTRTDRFLQTVVESWQIVARAVDVPEMIIRAIFPVVLHARALCREAGLHRIAGGIRPEPAAAIRAGLPPAVECRPRARCGGTSGTNSRADAHHRRDSRSTHVDPFRRSTEARHPEFRAARLRGVCARGAIRARRGIQSADAGVPAASRRSGGRLARTNGRRSSPGVRANRANDQEVDLPDGSGNRRSHLCDGASRRAEYPERLSEAKDGGPDFPQMEPTDQLDAPNRRLPESRVRRFAKRKSASRTSSIFLVNPSRSSTSPIERVGWLLAPEALFWEVAGTIVGTVLTTTICRSQRQPLQ